MKSISLLLTAIVSTQGFAASAQSWRLVDNIGDRPNRQTEWIDSDSLRRNGDIVRFSMQRVYETPQSTDVEGGVGLIEVNCVQATYQNPQIVLHYVGGQRITNTAGRGVVYDVSPGSVMHTALQMVCGRRALGLYATDPRRASMAFWTTNRWPRPSSTR